MCCCVFRDGKCATRSVVLVPGEHAPYEWWITAGGYRTYLRFLDASDYGTDHLVMYQCTRLLDDGTCDPHHQHGGVLTRHLEDVSEDTRVHLRQVLRDACLEPGDFISVEHNRQSLNSNSINFRSHKFETRMIFCVTYREMSDREV